MILNVLLRPPVGGRAQFDAGCRGAAHLGCQGQSQGRGAGAQVKHLPTAAGAAAQKVNAPLSQQLSFGAGNENTGADSQVEVPERRLSGDVLKRHTFAPASQRILKAVYYIGGNSGIGQERQGQILDVTPPGPCKKKASLRIGGFYVRAVQPSGCRRQNLADTKRISRQSADPLEPLSTFSSAQGFDNLVQSPVKDLVEVVCLVPGAMIDNPVFREVVGADALGTVHRANL